jgi:large-conductance mechanosensitive channel
MVFGVDTNPRFLLFSVIIGAAFTYILQQMQPLVCSLLVNPLFSWIGFTMLYATIFNVIYVLATYEANEEENITRIYIFMAIGFILLAIYVHFITPIILSITK